MLVCLQFLAGDLESTIANSSSYRFIVLGLGGGLLAGFLHRHTGSHSHIVGVEYDKVVLFQSSFFGSIQSQSGLTNFNPIFNLVHT